MSLVPFFCFGLMVGVVSRWLVPRGIWGGWVTSITLGVFGAFFGGLVGRAFGSYRNGEPAGFLMSVLGALLIVGAYYAAVAASRSLHARHRSP